MLQITLLGGLQLAIDGKPYAIKLLPGSRELLAYVLLNRDAPIARANLAFTLWPDLDEKRVRAKLRRNLFDLRNALPAHPDDSPWLLISTKSVRWNPTASYELDVEQFERLRNSAETAPQAQQLYKSDLLPELYADWIAQPREQLRLRYLTLLQHLIDRAQQANKLDAAIALTDQLLVLDPLRETTVQTAMRLRYQNNDRVGALRVFQEFSNLLAQELAVEPLSETADLFQHITEMQPLLPETGDAIAQPPNNLRAFPNRFFGRTSEMNTLTDQLLQQQGARLISVTGPGGCGKTRMVSEVAQRFSQQLNPTFPDGIFFVDLSAVTKPDLMIETVIQTLELAYAVTAATPKAAARAIGRRRMLIILDNFEQLLDSAPLVSDLLAYSPQLRMLVTSRARLRCYGEFEVQLSPLQLPADQLTS